MEMKAEGGRGGGGMVGGAGRVVECASGLTPVPWDSRDSAAPPYTGYDWDTAWVSPRPLKMIEEGEEGVGEGARARAVFCL